jgi:drug/metabolite transporter (DMT)-like permease
MSDSQKPQIGTYIKLFIAIAVWGGSFIATKFALKEISPVSVVWLRFLIGVIILGIPMYSHRDFKIYSARDIAELAWLGFLGITLHQWLQSSGLVTSEASTTAWLVSTTPIFMALLGWIFFKEKLTLPVISGIFLATIGVLFVVSKGRFSSILSGNFGAPGDLLIILSAPNWALFSVMSRPILEKYSPLKVTFYVLLFGWLFTSVQFFASGNWQEIRQLTTTGWSSILFLGVFCSALAYIFYNEGVKAFTSTQVGIFLYLEPVIATIIAALLLSETFGWASGIGAGFIIVGVWMVNKQAA